MTDTTNPATGAQPTADVSIIDSIIDNAELITEPEKQPSEPAEPETGKPEDDTPFPKKAVNAISRRDKAIGKLRAQYEAARTELEAIRASQQQATQKQPNANDGAPKEADYKSYAEYLEARADWIAEQKIAAKFAERDSKQKEAQETEQEAAWRNERIAAVDKAGADFSKEYPDVEALYQENIKTLQELPDTHKKALLAADNVPLAFYNLAKEGKLEDLADMSLEDARVEIRVAQLNQPAKPKSKAPAPLAAARGSVAPSKQLESMSGDELLDWINS
jgi:hypothetical protein